MTSIKGGGSPVTGYRYYFSLLMGVCRGPVDQVFLMTSGGGVLWDGTAVNATAYELLANALNGASQDPTPPLGAAGDYVGGPVTGNVENLLITKPDLYGGDAREGGMQGQMVVSMGDANQTLSAKIATALSGLRVSALRGVLTIFYDGLVCSNNPYPKQIKFRLRRAVKGWDGAVWYPEKAVIMLSDPAIPASSQTFGNFSFSGDTTNTTSTQADGTTTTVVTAQDGTQTFTTYDPHGSTNHVAVPAMYNVIYAMNGAHIIYECCTNRDWGRGMDRALIDNPTFTAAANTLFTENFGLCLKWSRADDVDTFIQTVIDHIGAVLYTDKVTGFLCLKLIRADYNVDLVPHFDYTHGLLSVSVAETSAQNTNADEIIVKYHSPVLDMDKEARAQNIAAINSQGSIFSTTRQYPGIPISTLAILVAQRDLKIFSSGLKRVTVKLDRRAYLLVPGDVIVVTAPDQNLSNFVLRVAGTEDTVVTDGTIIVTAVQDNFNQPLRPFTEQPQSSFRQPDLYPHPIIVQDAYPASYRDLYKMDGVLMDSDLSVTGVPRYSQNETFYNLLAQAPSPAAQTFDLHTNQIYPTKAISLVGTRAFCQLAHTVSDWTTETTRFAVTGDFNMSRPQVGEALMIGGSASFGFGESEMLVLRSKEVVAGVLWLTVGRGCVDSPARAHPAGSRLWAYDQLVPGNPTVYGYNWSIELRGTTRTSRGVLPLRSAPPISSVPTGLRQGNVYCGANFRVNGFPRDRLSGTTGPDLVCTWSHRNRLLQADKLIDEYAASIGPEAGVFYEIFVKRQDSSGFGYTYSVPPSAPGGGPVTFTLNASDIAATSLGTGPFTVTLRTHTSSAQAGSGVDVTATLNYQLLPAGHGYGGGYGGSYGGVSGYGSSYGNGYGR